MSLDERTVDCRRSKFRWNVVCLSPVLMINEPTKMVLALDFLFKVNTSKYSKKPMVFFANFEVLNTLYFQTSCPIFVSPVIQSIHKRQ